MPMERAVPAITFFACSRSTALRSSIFSFAMSSSCCLLSFPTLVCAFCEPFSMPRAFRIRREAGGFLTMKLKERYDRAHHWPRLSVELIDEFADIHTGRTKRSADRRCRRRFACLNLQLYHFGYLLGHIRDSWRGSSLEALIPALIFSRASLYHG